MPEAHETDFDLDELEQAHTSLHESPWPGKPCLCIACYNARWRLAAAAPALLATAREKERMREALFLLLQAIDDSNASIIDSKLLNAGIAQAREALTATESK